MNGKITVVVPIRTKTSLNHFIGANLELIVKNKFVVIDSGGGERLRYIAQYYEKIDTPMWTARLLGYEQADTKYILNLDCDTIIPPFFLANAIYLLEKNEADAVAIDYDPPQGHLAFGASLWKTEILKELYDFSIEKSIPAKLVQISSNRWCTLNNGWCECTYMWSRLKQSNRRLATLPVSAIHLKGERNG